MISSEFLSEGAECGARVVFPSIYAVNRECNERQVQSRLYMHKKTYAVEPMLFPLQLMCHHRLRYSRIKGDFPVTSFTAGSWQLRRNTTYREPILGPFSIKFEVVEPLQG